VSFASPELLFALIAVPLAAAGYVVFDRRRERRSTAWSRQQLQSNIVSRPPRRYGFLPAALFLLGVAFLLVGFARPQRAASSNGRGIGPTVVFAVDVSGSMAARDIVPTRLRAARSLAIKVVQKLPSNYQVAVLTFGNKVQLAAQPTLDRQEVIAHLPKTITPLAGTSLGDGISAALSLIIQAIPDGVPVNRLHPPGAIVVLTDGAQTGAGTEPQDAASVGYVYGIPINGVTIGTSHGSVTQPVKVDGFQTSLAIAVPALPLTLQGIGQLTGGASLDGSSNELLAAAPGKLVRALESEGLSAITQPPQGNHALSAAAGEIGLAFVLGGILLSGLWFGRLE